MALVDIRDITAVVLLSLEIILLSVFLSRVWQRRIELKYQAIIVLPFIFEVMYFSLLFFILKEESLLFILKISDVLFIIYITQFLLAILFKMVRLSLKRVILIILLIPAILLFSLSLISLLGIPGNDFNTYLFSMTMVGSLQVFASVRMLKEYKSGSNRTVNVTMRCRACNSVVESGSKFCSSCGKKIE